MVSVLVLVLVLVLVFNGNTPLGTAIVVMNEERSGRDSASSTSGTATVEYVPCCLLQ